MGVWRAHKFALALSAGMFELFQHVGTTKGFTLFETDDPEKLMYMAAHYMPLLRGNFVPILENAKGVEIWKKVKK